MVLTEKVLVVGLARNVAKHLGVEIDRLENDLKKIFAQVSFFIVESDSSDSTCNVLTELKEEFVNFDFISLGNLESKIPNRIERLTYCRNVYVDKIRSLSKYKNFDFIIVNDFDIKNNKLNLNSISKYLIDNSWDGLFANQSGYYYDIYALRSKNWSEGDCFEEYKNLSQYTSQKKAKKMAIWSKMRKISSKVEPIKVDSAFGGLAIYRKNLFLKFDYSNSENNYKISEHVNFNTKVTSDGGKLFILPSMTNFSWNSHNLSKWQIMRKIDSLTKNKKFKIIREFLRNRIA
jgi:hypothetical protein